MQYMHRKQKEVKFGDENISGTKVIIIRGL